MLLVSEMSFFPLASFNLRSRLLLLKNFANSVLAKEVLDIVDF
jgi:hypothetical protein